mmetsp:Transcript_10387/g.16460  ORF Transcript_10387/g.16460 Transcript_10387/m.16460 type:complete len:99 (-) Transcript_10387:389-685(-)
MSKLKDKALGVFTRGFDQTITVTHGHMLQRTMNGPLKIQVLEPDSFVSPFGHYRYYREEDQWKQTITNPPPGSLMAKGHVFTYSRIFHTPHNLVPLMI